MPPPWDSTFTAGQEAISLRIRQTIDSVGIVTIMPLCSTAIQTMPGGFEPKWGESHGESKIKSESGIKAEMTVRF